MPLTRRAFCLLTASAAVSACGASRRDRARPVAGLYPGETAEVRRLINRYAALYDVPPALIHRVIQRESDYRADARNGPYYGMMQILPQTARTMGHRGPASDLLNADTNLKYGVKYLRGAWLLSGGSYDRAVGWYSNGYYYEAKRRGMLVETGLKAG
jgi:soluble lytic murein transglycosylase-like protein